MASQTPRFDLMPRSTSSQRMKLLSQTGRRSSLEEFQPNTTSNNKFQEFTKNQRGTKKNLKEHILPISELMAIKERTLIDHFPDATKRLQDKEELKVKSAKRVQNWPNTLQAIRKQRDQWKFEKFKKEEIERRKIDEEEKKYQAIVKKQTLDRANKKLYFDQDRVRNFQSKMLLSDALQEREAQIEQLQQLKELEKVRNEIYVEQQKEIIKQQEEVEQRVQAQLQEKKRYTARILKEQHDEMQQNFVKKIQEEKIEGEIIKLHVQEALESQRQEDRKRIQKQKNLNKEVAAGNIQLQKFKAVERQKELEEEERIRQYAAQKEQIEEMKKIRANQRFKEKQAQLKKLQDTQYEKLLALKQDEELRINKQIEEAEIKAENVEKQKKEYKEKLVKKIDESLKYALQKKANEATQHVKEDKKYKEFWVNKNKEIAKREEQDKKETYQRNKTLQEYHQQQIDRKQKARENVFIGEIDEQIKIQAKRENEDQDFDVWTKAVINEWKDDGKNIYPMLKELATEQKL